MAGADRTVPEPAQHRAGIVGLGLIGASFGGSLRRAGWLVTGLDASLAVAEEARGLGAVDRIVTSMAELCSAPQDLVVVAVPPGATIAIVKSAIQAGAKAVTDVASVKAPIVNALAGYPAFLGGHPMAGGEKPGPAAARPDLFVGAKWVLTPGPATTEATQAIVTCAVEAAGARPVRVEPDRHDRYVAIISHLPHVAAAALVSVVAHHRETTPIGELASTGWRDTTRVASGAPALWADILRDNGPAVVEALDAYIAELARLRDTIRAADASALDAQLRCAADARDNITHDPRHRRSPGCHCDEPRRVTLGAASARG